MNTQLITKVTGGLGHIILNAPTTLNALSQQMANELTNTLSQWESDPNVQCLFIEGSGTKAFCAGGDIKNLFFALKEGDKDERGFNPTCLNFFKTEYKLDYQIHTYKKPIITWNSGITMGGGMGLMNGASHRIVTETSLLAMPEVSIGLYPDVGATYFLNKLPPGVAQFLAVTGARFNGADAMELGLSDFYFDSSIKETLLSNLAHISWSQDIEANRKLISLSLANLSQENIPKSQISDLYSYFEKLEHISDPVEFYNIAQTLPQTDWVKNSLTLFEKGSPSSTAIILEQLKRGKKMSLKECFMSELNLSVHCSLRSDFYEGVRSLLIDKDLSPKWEPTTREELTKEWVDSFFVPMWSEEDHPFKDWSAKKSGDI